MLKNSRIKNVKKSSMLLFVILLFVLSAFGATASGWYDTGWQYRKEITIDNTKVSASLSDFPVLIDIIDADLASNAQADGDDILFTDDSDVKLSHEIELYNSTTGHLVAWVKVPSLSSSIDTVIYVYYGNSSVGSQQDVNNVWDSDFVMVQHLEEASGNVLDSTTNGNNGIPVGGSKYFGGVYKKSNIKRKIKPYDDFKERMTIEAYNKVSVGISICIVSIALGLFFSNRVMNTVSSVGVAGGAVWTLIGFLKLFVATHIVLLCWLAAILVIFTLIFRYRKRSIVNSVKWIKGLVK